MPAGPRRWTEEIVQRRWIEGRGQGDEDAYTPWQYVQEFSSRGTQTRVPMLTQARTVHTFSYGERGIALFIEFYQRPHCYREQFAMNREITMGAAKALGIRYPRYPHTKVAVVMTLDAVVQRRRNDRATGIVVYDFKRTAELSNRRSMEKLSLHKMYCAWRGWPHHIVTEQTLPKILVRNLDWLRSGPRRQLELDDVEGLFTTFPQLMQQELFQRRPKQPVNVYCAAFDKSHQLPPGTGLRLYKILVWDRNISPDLTKGALELQPLTFPHQLASDARMREAA